MKKETKQTIDQIVGLVNKVSKTQQNGGFTIYELGFPENIKVADYYESDLTKSYIEFVKDIFNQKYGNITEKLITSFGDSIKTSKNDFKESYRKSIKEIVPGKIYIHTIITTEKLRLLIDDICESMSHKSIHKEPNKETGKIEPLSFLSFDEAKHIVQSMNIKNVKEWREFTKSNKRPNNLPFSPERVYKNEWISWSQFLGRNERNS
jgi:hypothetical protein